VATRRAPDIKAISGSIESHYRRYRAELVRFLALKGRQLPDEVSDLVQEVYIRLIRYWPDDAIENPRAYVFKVALNVLRRRSSEVSAERRRCSTHEPEELEKHIKEHSRLWIIEDGGEETALGDLERVLNQLPLPWRAALLRQQMDGWTHQQIADELGVSTNTVKGYLSKAINHCRIYLSMPAKRKRRGAT
jgi:RNA polymerase sigma factor (sigma-70 family)